MVNRWISEDRVTYLANHGRLRDSFDTVKAVAPIRKDGGSSVSSFAASPSTAPLVTLCRSMKLPEPIPEYRFAPPRKWRADYCWPAHMLMLEVNGGVWTQGRHTRGQGAIDDMEKLSEAAIMGYRVLYCTPEQLHNGVALDRIVRALTDRAAA